MKVTDEDRKIAFSILFEGNDYTIDDSSKVLNVIMPLWAAGIKLAVLQRGLEIVAKN